MTASRTARARHERGFTLAEVLVSLFLFGLVSSMLLAVIDMENRADRAVRQRDDSMQQVITAQNLLRDRIEQMRGELDTQGTGELLAANGTDTTLSFEAPTFAGAGPHALHVFHIERTSQRQLMLYYVSQLSGLDVHSEPDPTDPRAEGWSSIRLLDGVETVQFTYFGPDRITGRDMWQQSWQGRRALPKLVRLQIGFAAGDPRVWPVLLVRPWSGVRSPCPDGKTGTDCGGNS